MKATKFKASLILCIQPLIAMAAGARTYDLRSPSFDVALPSYHVNSNSINASFTIYEGVPAYMSVLVDPTNLDSAAWVPYSPTVSVNLGSTDGTKQVWFGLKGGSPYWLKGWKRLPITRDTVPPLIVITNPLTSVVSQPMIELQGYSPEPLGLLSYDVTNAAGLIADQRGYTTGYAFTRGVDETTNWFICQDIALANGANTIALYATDRAGNTSTNVFTYILDYSGDTNPPVIRLDWPLDRTLISGDIFTCRGMLDDFTASLTATLADARGKTNIFRGKIERNGKFWLENLPLAAGTNLLSLTATDAAGNSSVTNFSVSKSDLIVTIDPVTDDLWLPTVRVHGTVSDPTCTVVVNGVQAQVDGSGHWTATDVPVNDGGTACFVASAYAAGQATPSAQADEHR